MGRGVGEALQQISRVRSEFLSVTERTRATFPRRPSPKHQPCNDRINTLLHSILKSLGSR